MEGIPKYTDEEREAKLKQTLQKSLRLTSRLVQSMDKNSEDGESEEEEDFSFSSERRMRKRKQDLSKRKVKVTTISHSAKEQRRGKEKIHLKVERLGRNYTIGRVASLRASRSLPSSLSW